MKKCLLAAAAAALLAGCSEESAEHETETAPETEQHSTPAAEEETETTAEEESVEETETNSQEELAQYDEYEILSEKIDLSVYEASIETDNPGNRVLLFSEADGRKRYKSLFVKDSRHLKIISLSDEGLLYNDVIN